MPPARDADGAAYRPHKWKNHFKCIIPGCPSSTSTNIAKLHSFPWRDMPRAEKWMSAVGRGDLVGAPAKALLRLRVCDLHFARSLRRGKNLKLFDSTAVPTLRLPTVPTEPTPAASAAPVNGTHTPIRVPKELARFLSLRETLARSNTARVGFDRAFCRRALRLRHAAPRAYDVLWRALRLPAPARLARLPLPLGSRLHPLVLAALSARLARLPASHRHAALCLDEVPLSGAAGAFYYCDTDRLVGLHEVEGRLRARRAASALVLALRGAGGTRWTQPLAYWLLEAEADARELAAALRRLLTALQDAGVRVRLLLSALGPTCARLARALRATPERPYVLHARLGRLPFLHDPDQLLVTLRDTLRAYDVLLRAEDGTELRARWAHVEELREQDRRSGRPRLLPELTRARVAPDAAEAARPQHALAALSARVGAALAGAGEARRGTARLVAVAAGLAASLRSLGGGGGGGAAARLRRRADAATAALGEMRVASWAGEEHAAEEFSRALRLTLEGAVLAAAQCEEPLPLARCGLRPLRRWAERVEGLSPKEFRVRFRRWGARHLARAAPGPGRDDLQALLEAAEREPSEEPLEEASGARVSPGALQHAVPLRGGVRRAQAALLLEMRRAHACAAWARWAQDARRWRALLAALELRFRRVWAGRVEAAGVCARLAQALAGALPAPPCACFPRDTLCRLYARFRLRAALRHHNAPARPHLAPWAFA